MRDFLGRPVKVSNVLRYDSSECVPKPKKVTVRVVAEKGIVYLRVRKPGQSGWVTPIVT